MARVIWNGIESEIFRPGSRDQARERLGLPPDVPLVLTSAHTGFKDADTVFAAVRKVECDRDGDARPTLMVLGMDAGPATIGSWEVRYLGFVADRRRMADLYRSADVFVHAARGEVFGKTIAEAMACETVTIATAVGGIREVFGDSAAILVPPNEPLALAESLRAVLGDAPRRVDLGREAARYALARFTLEQQTERWLSYYDDVLADWHARGEASPASA
jgi:glycosyltransferase involved in cell wall biosynthesis